MPTLSEILIQVAIASVPLGVAWIAYRSATNANRLTADTALKTAERQAEIERTKVDAEAFSRAKAIYEDALSQMEKQLVRVQTQLDKITHQLATEQDTSNSLRHQVRALQKQLTTLERMVNELRRQLIDAGLRPLVARPSDTGPFPLTPPPSSSTQSEEPT